MTTTDFVRPTDTAAEADRLELPDRGLVVLAGLPGAGKTTLLRRLAGTDGVRTLDSEDVAARLRRSRVPYRLLRPFVHALHLLHVALAVHAETPCVLTTDPCTSPRRRWLLRTTARLSGRSLQLVLVDASPGEAREGRRVRGRDLSSARVARHEHRYGQLHSGVVHRSLTRAQAMQVVAVVARRQPQSSAGTRPHRSKEDRTMRAARARRPGAWTAALATALGLWFGLTAPDVSPVLPSSSAVDAAPRSGAVLDRDDGVPAGTPTDLGSDLAGRSVAPR